MTLHEASAAYVLASQRPEQEKKPDMHTSYEPVCLDRWSWSVLAMDETAGIIPQPSKENI